MINNKADLRDYLVADKAALKRIRRFPPPQDLIWRYEILLRKSEYYHNCRRDPLGRLMGLFFRWRLFRLGVRCGFSIPLNTCGKGLNIAHIGPIIINGGARLGDYCRLHVCVSIGTRAGRSAEAPVIGNRVYIGPGAKLFGAIEIADGIAIGANSVVNKSFTQPDISIAGIPAKKISDKGAEGLLYYPQNPL